MFQVFGEAVVTVCAPSTTTPEVQVTVTLTPALLAGIQVLLTVKFVSLRVLVIVQEPAGASSDAWHVPAGLPLAV